MASKAQQRSEVGKKTSLLSLSAMWHGNPSLFLAHDVLAIVLIIQARKKRVKRQPPDRLKQEEVSSKSTPGSCKYRVTCLLCVESRTIEEQEDSERENDGLN